jgi:hypothetical protein
VMHKSIPSDTRRSDVKRRLLVPPPLFGHLHDQVYSQQNILRQTKNESSREIKDLTIVYRPILVTHHKLLLKSHIRDTDTDRITIE